MTDETDETPLVTGTIITIKFEKGFGFITDGRTEYFFHRSSTVPHMWESLKVGQAVTFRIVPSPKGPRAAYVTLAN